ncbi:MAG: hypothetical protein GC159_18335 [Phycisphaera sp.]|nr:hypothetical protein [Phycisphaera sp.]
MLAGLIAAITGFIMLMDIMLTPIDRRGWLLIIGGVILGALGFGMHVKAGMIDGQPEGASHDIADR